MVEILARRLVVGGALFAIGYFGWDFYTGCSFVVYGMFVRLVYVLHATWFVNSASHIWGYRNYETRDNSRNLWWTAPFLGWHNNHHNNPSRFSTREKWWELDLVALMGPLLRLGSPGAWR